MNFFGLWSDRIGTFENIAQPPGQPVRVISSDNSYMIVLGHCLVPDAVLSECLSTVRATRRLGAAATGWPGCYSLAVAFPWELLLLTDPVGQFPWYTAAVPGGSWFGSSPIGLAERVRTGVDHRSLAMSIACIDVPDLSENRTEFNTVHRLPLGSVLTVNSSGSSVEPWCTLATDHGTTFDDAAGRLRLSLSEAMEARVTDGRRVTSDFSGGIDSSALVFLGRRAGGNISGYTSHHSAVDIEDDLAWARHFAVHAPELAHHLVPDTSEELPYQNLVIGEYPHPASIATGPLRARLRLVADHGSDVHIVGEGGDLVVGAPPAYLADLARHGQLTELWRHCLRWGRVRQCSPLALLLRATSMATTSRPQALRSLAAAIRRAVPVPDDRPWHRDAVSYWDHPRGHWLTRRARADLADHVRAMADESDDDLGVADAVTLSQLRTQVMTQRAVRDVGLELGVEVHAPYLDTDVVRACLSLPAYRRADPGVAKPLLRSALTGLVPDAVLTRPTKGDYTRSSFQGVRRAAPALRQLLAESVAADHGLLDPVPVRAVLERAVQGLPTPWRALNQVLAVELWLRDVSRKVVGV